jgi:uncharacterized coiled-coil protein SlyX
MSDRLTDLEIRYTHLERLVTELSNVLYEERLARDKLEARLKDLEQRLRSAEEPSLDEPPPHY